MPALSVLRELPDGFACHQDARGVLACRRDREDALRSAGFGLAGGGGDPSADLSGRGRMREIETPEGARLVVRPFRHGGLLRWLTGERFADPERPFRELIVSCELSGLGVPTPAVVAARALRAPLFGWRLDLVTERVEGVLDLAQVLEAVREGRVGHATRTRLSEELGRLVGGLHRAGGWHADLQPRNVLVAHEALERAPARERAGPGLWLIDLEGSRRGEFDPRERRQNLGRLARAVLRREERGAPFLRRSDWRRFLRGYDRALERDPGAWKEDWRLVGRATRHARWHRIGWWLEERFGNLERRDGRAPVRR